MRTVTLRRVVVTGVGAITAHGNDAEAIFQALVRGEHRMGPIDAEIFFDSDSHPQTAGRQVVAVPYADGALASMAGVEERRAGQFDRHQLFALIAAGEAMGQAGYRHLEDIDDPERFGCIGGTGDGGLRSGYEADMLAETGKKLGPYANVKQLPNLFAGLVAQRWGLKGPNATHTTACAASAHAMGDAATAIAMGEADAILVVGAEAAITKYGIASFVGNRAMGHDSLPYHKDRKGFVMGEGAAALVLEDLEHARARGATILAEVAGYGRTGDGNPDLPIVAPDPDGGYRAASRALAMAQMTPYEVDYVNAHGTGTGGDSAELKGIRKWAGNHAAELLVSSTKSYTGHLLGGAGALEAVLSIKMMVHSLVLPTRDLSPETLDPDCDGVVHVMAAPVPRVLNAVLSNSFGFGGTNAAVLLKRYQDAA